jgi:hypothetical protein
MLENPDDDDTAINSTLIDPASDSDEDAGIESFEGDDYGESDEDGDDED